MIKNPLTVFVSVLLPRGVVGTRRGWQHGAKKGLTRMRPSQEGRKEPDHVGWAGGQAGGVNIHLAIRRAVGRGGEKENGVIGGWPRIGGGGS